MAAQATESDQIKQFKEFLGTYNKVTENCFMDCVRDFTTREVKPEESSCSESCLQKYLKMTQRISMRFQEYHIQQNEALAAKAGLMPGTKKKKVIDITSCAAPSPPLRDKLWRQTAVLRQEVSSVLRQEVSPQVCFP
ncbi:Mitochondrial import inner membrane translocase subunit Tim9 [Dissostichus eleginoides]|nr:Mitochondrial import inner membrane translocase subunit Tim9 [Dissostichus eleginoides]